MPLQDANPTPSFGGFGLTEVHDDAKTEIIRVERQRQKEQPEPGKTGQRPATDCHP